MDLVLAVLIFGFCFARFVGGEKMTSRSTVARWGDLPPVRSRDAAVGPGVKARPAAQAPRVVPPQGVNHQPRPTFTFSGRRSSHRPYYLNLSR